MIELHGQFTNAKVMIDEVEQMCISQIYTFLNHKAFTNPVVIMPDTHAGKGSVIGFTMKLTDLVIPNVIGVDIGCGVSSCNVGKFDLPEKELLDHRIRKYVPMGFNSQPSTKTHLKEAKRIVDQFFELDETAPDHHLWGIK